MRTFNQITFLSLHLMAMSLSSACQTNDYKQYGEIFEHNATLNVNEIPAFMSTKDSLASVFQGTIETSCQVKGCWMTVRTNEEETFRITFKDYGFFVPINGLSGKNAIFQGYCIRKTTSVAELQHYAEDAGKSQKEIALITQPKDEFSFVASGVKIEE